MPLSPAQLAARQFRLGASELATLFGHNPYCTPFGLWAKKTGRLLDDSDEGSAATELGNLLEPVLLDWTEKEYGEELLRNIECAHPSYPLTATLDGQFAVSRKVVEAKTGCLAGGGRELLAQWSDEEFPLRYWYQIQAQMFSAGVDEGLLVALVGLKGLLRYEVRLDEQFMTECMEIAAQWWDYHVAGDAEPEVGPADAETLRKVKPLAGLELELDEEHGQDVDRYIELKARIKELEADADLIKDKLVRCLGLATLGKLPDGRQIKFDEHARSGYTVAPTKYRQLVLPRATAEALAQKQLEKELEKARKVDERRRIAEAKKLAGKNTGKHAGK